MVIAAQAVLDIDAARRLADYDDLDDAGITRAVEQLHTQRWGRWDLPAHLAAIDRLCVVIVERGHVRRVDLSRQALGSESALLDALVDVMPATRADLVDWDGHDVATLLARCVATDRQLPRALAGAATHHLAGWVAPTAADHPAPDRAFEDECRAIFAAQDAVVTTTPGSIAARASARTRLWWRLAHATCRLHPSRRADLETQLAALEPS